MGRIRHCAVPGWVENGLFALGVLVSVVVFRLGPACLFGAVLGLGGIGVWIAMGMDWLARPVCFVWRYRREIWRPAGVIA